jgi:predicted O-methyltransferase YrrM
VPELPEPDAAPVARTSAGAAPSADAPEGSFDARVAGVAACIAAASSTTPPFAGAFDLPTMLADAEVSFLYHLARDVATGWGDVAELGTFLGGSTVALGRGLMDGGVPSRIATFDLFRQPAWPAFNIREGDDVLARWESTVTDVRHLVDVHPGYLEDYRPGGGESPLEILFVDIVKVPSTIEPVMQQFVSRLTAGSVLVHQDLFHWGSPWVAMTVEALWDHLIYVGQVARASGVFVVKDSLADAARSLSWDHVSPSAGLVLIDSLAQRFGHPTLKGTLELAALWLARNTDPALFERRRAALEPRLSGPRLRRWYEEVLSAEPEGALRPGGRKV